MKIAAVFAIAVGGLMVVQWTLLLLKGQVPRPEDNPISGRGFWDMLFHWLAEYSTAIVLIVAGAGVLLEAGWGLSVYLVATGMLVYSLINSPGFFAQQGKWSMVGMFLMLLILALASLFLVS